MAHSSLARPFVLASTPFPKTCSSYKAPSARNLILSGSLLRLVQAPQSVRLWDFCESLGGLDEDMNEGTLSHGQRQLFCLVRAVINPSSALIMDEVGGSVNADTDALIHKVLQKEFEACTAIAIVYKLHTMLDFDHFVVLYKGHIVEKGPPHELLERPGSLFKALYDSMRTGEIIRYLLLQ